MKAWKSHLEILSRYVDSLVTRETNLGDSLKQVKNCLMKIEIDIC